MSGEFGEYRNGYFDDKVADLVSDCQGGSEQLTHLWGELLNSFHPVAKAIALTEACDSGVAELIFVNMNEIDNISAKLRAVQDYLKPYREIARRAAKEAIEQLAK